MADSSTSITVSEMNDLLRQVTEKLERLKDLTKPRKGILVDPFRIKDRVNTLIEDSLKSTRLRIEQMTQL